MSSSLFQSQENIFQKQTQGEISFGECWKQQKQLLEKCEELLRNQLKKSDFLKHCGGGNQKGEKELASEVEINENAVKKEANEPECENDQNESKESMKTISSKHLKIEEMEVEDIKKETEEVNTGNEETKHGCKVCSFRSKRLTNLKVHVERTHLRLRYFCKLCDVQFKDRGSLKTHIRSKTDEDPYKNIIFECGVCIHRGTGEEFITHVENKHIVIYDVFKPASKDRKEEVKSIKEDEFESSKRIKKEVDVVVNSNKQQNQSNHLGKDDFKCEFCDKDFYGRNQASSLRWSHTERLHMRVVYKCAQCEYEIATKTSLYSHIDENHVHEDVNHAGLKQIRQRFCKYKCSVCNKLQSNRLDLLAHMREAHEDILLSEANPRNKHSNTQGTKSKSEKKNMGTKMKCSSKRRLLCCPQAKCRFKTGLIGNLRVHLGNHLGSKFSCTICDQKSKTRFQLTTHMKDDHKQHQNMQDQGWCDEFISFYCKVCDLTGTSKMFDQHLEKVHYLPKTSGRGKKI